MYELYGLKLADMDNMESSFNLLHTDVGKPISVSHYQWCIKNGENAIVVDTGMSQEEINKGPSYPYNISSPVDQLKKVGVDPRNVKTLIVTHLHGDHFSAFDLYPNATFYIQRKEVEFFAAVDVKNKDLILAVNNVPEIVRLNYEGRVKLVDGDEEIAPGLSLILVGAHTPGSQMIAVKTSQGTAVLCGDVVNLYRNIEENIPCGIVYDLVQAYLALEKARKLASSPDLIIPSHDPLTMVKFLKVADGVIRIG